MNGSAPGLVDLGAGAADLFGRDPGRDLGHLVEHQGQQLRHLAFAGAGIDAEQAAVGIGGVEAVNAVDQTPLLADTLEQARGHAAAEQG